MIFTLTILATVGANFVGFALSYDDRMGRDSAIECVNENGVVRAYTSFTNVIDGYSSPRIEVCSNVSLSDVPTILLLSFQSREESNHHQTS